MRRQEPSALPTGPRVTLLLGGLVVVLNLAVLLWHGPDEQGLRSVIRMSARTSIVLFLAAYVASSLLRLRPGSFTRWLMKNRRWIGLSFATSHAIHLAAIVALVLTVPDVELATATLIGGGLAYVLIALMAATSNDRAVRWLGTRQWRNLHWFGVHYIWLIFMLSYAPRALTGSVGYSILTFLLIAGWAVRLTAWQQREKTSAVRVQKAA